MVADVSSFATVLPPQQQLHPWVGRWWWHPPHCATAAERLGGKLQPRTPPLSHTDLQPGRSCTCARTCLCTCLVCPCLVRPCARRPAHLRLARLTRVLRPAWLPMPLLRSSLTPLQKFRRLRRAKQRALPAALCGGCELPHCRHHNSRSSGGPWNALGVAEGGLARPSPYHVKQRQPHCL